MTTTTHEDDPLGVFQPSAAAIEAAAKKLLRRAGIFSPTSAQLDDARESARIEYSAAAENAIRTGRVRP